jgi:ABC-type polysaccharide/polyol phosphate export permease
VRLSPSGRARLSEEEQIPMLTTACRGAITYLIAIWEYRYFWLCLVKAELQRRYRRSALGLGWSLVQPLSMMLVLAVVYRHVFGLSIWTFAPLLLIGLAFWNFISGTVLQGCGSLVSAESYIRQHYAPMAIFPLRTVLTVGFHAMVSLAMAISSVWIMRGLILLGMLPPEVDQGQPNLPVLLTLIPTLALLFLFAWSVAVVMSFAHVYFPDTQHLAEVGLQVLMYLTPIIYPPQMLVNHGLGFLLEWNPLAVLLQLLRDPILYGVVPPLHQYGHACLFVALFLALAGWVVARHEHHLIFAM